MRVYQKQLFVILACSLLLVACGQSISNRLKNPIETHNAFGEANEDNPGEAVDIKSSLAYGCYTIVDFSSKYCPACQELKGYLQKIPGVRKDIVIRTFDVDRKGSAGIDWSSPLCQKYNIHSLPHLVIFSDTGKEIAQGNDAKQQVLKVINEDVLNAHSE